MKDSLKTVSLALKNSFDLLQRRDPLILSSSTAFFATFSLSPIIILFIQIFSLYFKTESIKRQFFLAIGSTVGTETAGEIERIVSNFISIERNYWPFTIAGLFFLVFVSTTLLSIVKKAIERIWHIRPKAKLHFKYHSKERGIYLAFLLFTGVLILLSLFVDIRLKISMDYMQAFWPQIIVRVVQLLGNAFAIIMITGWFTVLFKVIPDANITWDSAFSGGLLTGVLFSAGKFILNNILIHARVETIFGASASFALLLLFIFYSSFILYYGAAFTYEYSEMKNNRICATRYSDEYEERIVDRGKSTSEDTESK